MPHDSLSHDVVRDDDQNARFVRRTPPLMDAEEYEWWSNYRPDLEAPYVGMQLAQDHRHGDNGNRVTMLRGLNGHPILVSEGRIMSADEVIEFMNAALDGLAALPENTEAWFAYEVDKEERRRAEARRERAEKKQRGPVPKAGYIYMIGCSSIPYENERGIKIGWSTDPTRRACDLDGWKPDSGRDIGLQVLCSIPTGYVHQAEQLFHKHFAHLRHGKTEWFALTEDHVRWFEEHGRAFISERGLG